MRGAQAALIPYYVTAAVAMYALGLLGYLDWGRYERWLVLAVLFVFETYAVTRPGLPGVLERVVNPVVGWGVGVGGNGAGRAPYYLPFQAIALARKLSVTVYIAFSQIGPLLAADTRSGQLVVGGGSGNNAGNGRGGKNKAGDEEKALREALDRLDAVVKQVDNDATMLLDTEMVPFAGDQETRGSMWVKAKEWLVQNTIRSDPMVRDALGKSFAKRSVEVPVGVRERGSREPEQRA